MSLRPIVVATAATITALSLASPASAQTEAWKDPQGDVPKGNIDIHKVTVHNKTGRLVIRLDTSNLSPTKSGRYHGVRRHPAQARRSGVRDVRRHLRRDRLADLACPGLEGRGLHASELPNRHDHRPRARPGALGHGQELLGQLRQRPCLGASRGEEVRLEPPVPPLPPLGSARLTGKAPALRAEGAAGPRSGPEKKARRPGFGCLRHDPAPDSPGDPTASRTPRARWPCESTSCAWSCTRSVGPTAVSFVLVGHPVGPQLPVQVAGLGPRAVVSAGQRVRGPEPSCVGAHGLEQGGWEPLLDDHPAVLILDGVDDAAVPGVGPLAPLQEQAGQSPMSVGDPTQRC